MRTSLEIITLELEEIDDCGELGIHFGKIIGPGSRIVRKFLRMRARITPKYIIPSCWSDITHFNVVSELPNIQVPTLIIHAEGETRFPLNQAKCMKEHIPNAKLVILEGVTSHLHPISEPERTWDDIEEFVGD